MTTPTYQGLFNGCVFYADFKGDAKELISQNDGTLGGTPTLTTNRLGIVNSAYSFNSYNDFITLGTDIPLGGTFTIMGWMYFNSTASQATVPLFAKRTTLLTTPYVAFDIDVGNGILKYVSSAHSTTHQTVSSGLSFSSGTWYLIAYTWDGTNMEGFQDGVSKGSNTITHIDQSVTNRLGSWANASGYTINGNLGEVIIWNRELSVGEIKAYYDITKNKVIAPYMRRTMQQ